MIAPPDGLLELNERKRVVMRFDIVTIFPAMVEQALGAGIVGRAIERGTLTSACTTCGTSRPIGIAWWTTCRTAAGRGWC